MSALPHIDLSAIPEDQRDAVATLMRETASLKEINKRLEHLVAELNHVVHGKKSEKLDEDERQLAFEDLQIAVSEAEEQKQDQAPGDDTPKRKRVARRNRGNLPRDLPRIEQVVEPETLVCPWGGRAPPAALFKFSRDRQMIHPNKHLAGWQGVLQADAYSGYNDLYLADRSPGPARSALCWSHARRKFFELADIAGNVRKNKPAHDISPVALEAVKRIDAIFDVEREINGMDAAARLAVRQDRCRPMVEELHTWLLEERARMSKHNSVAKAIDYMMPPKGDRWDAFTAFLEDGRICLTNNAAERALRGIALGRKSWLFAGSERGGDRAAFMYTLIVSCKMNDIDPQAWMADVLARLPDITVSRLYELLPWNWKAEQEAVKAA